MISLHLADGWQEKYNLKGLMSLSFISMLCKMEIKKLENYGSDLNKREL